MADTNNRTKTLQVIEACLKDRFSEQEIASILVDQDVLIVEHNPYYITADSIANALDSYGYEVGKEVDGGADGLWALATLQADTDDTVEIHKSTVRPTVILSGVFWIVSMLSLIGGNWDYLKYFALLSVTFGLPPIAIKACVTLRRFHFDVNSMMLFAVLGALGTLHSWH
jgi:Cd2+/Zn2+-exporting ATPase